MPVLALLRRGRCNGCGSGGSHFEVVIDIEPKVLAPRCNNNFYSTAPAMTGPWTYPGYLAPVTDPSNDISLQRTWLSQTTWVQPVVGSKGTVYLYWGDHWDNCGATSGAGSSNYSATFVFQPLIFDTSTKTLLPTYLASWSLDVGAGTWSQ
jgi:hypothetical protein